MKAAVDYWLGNDREYEAKHKPDWYKEARSNLPMTGVWPSVVEEQFPKNIGAISVVFVEGLTSDEKRHLSILLDKGKVRFVLARIDPSVETKQRTNVFISHSGKVSRQFSFSSFWEKLINADRPFSREEPPTFYERLRPLQEHRIAFLSKENRWLNLISSRKASLFDDVPGNMYLAAINKIKQLGRYSEGWDGFDAKAPTVKAIEDAQAFIQKLRTRNLVLPYISLATDGEINFLWNQHSIHLDLGFYGNGKYSYYGRTATGEEYFEDDVLVDSPLPRSILTLLAHA